MDIKSATLVYFSPTSTTRKVLETIAQGMGLTVSQTIDITRPEVRSQMAPDLEGQVVLVGAPVYGGRLPLLAADYFSTLKSSDTPVVPVVVYGNREFEDALLELKDILEKGGLHSVAAGAFIGEHSFSTEDSLIAPNRPDTEDLNLARDFGRKVARVLAKATDLNEHPSLKVPGNFPYKERKKLGVIDFIDVTDDCDECSTCVAVCPVNAIDRDNGYATVNEICIHCCACIKACPRGARSMKDGPFKDITQWLFENYTARKEPEVFFPG